MAGTDMAQWRKANSDPLLVEVSLLDGSKLRATAMIQRGRSLCDLFNMPDQFMEIDAGEQGMVVVARSAIRAVRPITAPKTDQLEKRLAGAGGLDPFATLGVPKTATPEEIHDARTRLLEVYHPDSHSSAKLPPEVMEYLKAMTARIEEAFVQIGSSAETKPVAVTAP